MALTFATAQLLSKAIPMVAGVPLSIAAWVNASSFAAFPAIATIGNASGSDYFSAQISNTGRGVTERSAGNSVDDVTNSIAGAMALSTWFHYVLICYDATNRGNWVNGVQQVTGSLKNVGTLTLSQIAGVLSGGTQFYGTGLTLAQVAIWKSVVADIEIPQLYVGVSPKKIQPSNLVSYNMLIGASSEPDYCSSTPWTVTGSPVFSPNPRLYFP